MNANVVVNFFVLLISFALTFNCVLSNAAQFPTMAGANKKKYKEISVKSENCV